MSSYHIDQSGRVVMQVADTDGCRGCMYKYDGVRICTDQEPLENDLGDGATLCGRDSTIYVLVDTTK